MQCGLNITKARCVLLIHIPHLTGQDMVKVIFYATAAVCRRPRYLPSVSQTNRVPIILLVKHLSKLLQRKSRQPRRGAFLTGANKQLTLLFVKHMCDLLRLVLQQCFFGYPNFALLLPHSISIQSCYISCLLYTSPSPRD